MPPAGTTRNLILSVALAALCVAGAIAVSRATAPEDEPEGTPVARFSPAAVDATREVLDSCTRDVCSSLGDPWSHASCALSLPACTPVDPD